MVFCSEHRNRTHRSLREENLKLAHFSIVERVETTVGRCSRCSSKSRRVELTGSKLVARYKRSEPDTVLGSFVKEHFLTLTCNNGAHLPRQLDDLWLPETSLSSWFFFFFFCSDVSSLRNFAGEGHTTWIPFVKQNLPNSSSLLRRFAQVTWNRWLKEEQNQRIVTPVWIDFTPRGGGWSCAP